MFEIQFLEKSDFSLQKETISCLQLTTKNSFLKDGQEVVLRGIGGTTTEYLFKDGIMTHAFLEFSWNELPHTRKLPSGGNPQNPLTYVAYNDKNGIDKQLDIILHHGNKQIIPAFRIPLNLDFYLHDKSTAIGNYSNKGRSTIYQFCIDLLVNHFTEKGIAVILELHWNAAGSNHEQCYGHCNPSDGCDGYMAIAEATTFWTKVATKYKANDLVLFELYNEPMCNDGVLPESVWLNGGTLNGQSTMYAGMKQMYEVVRDTSAENIVIVGGNNWAYNPEYCKTFQSEVNPVNTIYNLHPYQGQGQGAEKDVKGFKKASSTLLNIAPVIITEFGQYCLSSNNNYNEQIIQMCNEGNISWVAWAWRPPHGGHCKQPDVNEGSELYNPANHKKQGGDWSRIWPKYSVGQA